MFIRFDTMAVDLISMKDLDKKIIEKILASADLISEGKLKIDLKGKILATLFFEPSTRTKMSFQAAALRSNLKVLDFQPELSSLKKGESFSDTIRMVSSYADVLAIRHHKEGAARFTADLVDVPVINCGDGGNQHPTQTMIDLFTIKKYKGRIKGLNILLFGDLKHARAMRSLLYGLAIFGASVVLSSPPGLEMEAEYVNELKKKYGLRITLKSEPDFSSVDVLYMCRVQEERFSDQYAAKVLMDKFTLKIEDIKSNEDLIVLHPLPRLNEIPSDIDSLPQAKYFEQAHFAIPVRQAILDYVLR